MGIGFIILIWLASDLNAKDRILYELSGLQTLLDPGPPFTKQTDVLSQDLVKSQSRKFGC